MRHIELLMFDVAIRHQVNIEDIKGRSRVPHVVAARQEFCARAQAELGMSLYMIGRFIGKDASSVHAAIKRHKQDKSDG